MKFAKKLKEHLPKEGPKVLLHQALAGMDSPHSITEVHASDVTKLERSWCAREVALAETFALQKQSSFIGTSLSYTFALGRAIENLVRNEWLADKALGRWRCTRCYTTVGDTTLALRPKKCPCCEAPPENMKYLEVPIVSLESGIRGSPDMYLRLPSAGTIRLLEIKSIDKDQFRELDAPLAEHRLRTNLYLRLIDESDHPSKAHIDTTEGYVLYLCKGFGIKDESLAGLHDTPFSPFKEYVVHRNDKATDALVAQAKQLKLWRQKEGYVAPDRICDTPSCKRAKQCIAAKYCFVEY